MNLDFKKIFSLFAIVFIVDECGARSDETASSNGQNKMKTDFQSEMVYPSDLRIRNTKRPYRDPYSYNQHRRPINQGYWYDDDWPNNQNILYPTYYDNRTQIPLDLIQRYNDYSEVNDLLLNFVEGEDEDGILSSRFGERSAAVIPKAATCMPELRTVEIAVSNDPSVLYIPSCTRLERCGGCCSHSLLSCQPTEVETVSLQVVKTQFQGGNKVKYMGKEVVLVEKHTKCKCQCKIQKENCTSFQDYNKSECRCICTNRDEEKKCLKENATKLWNPDTCMCECRNITQCSTGYIYDIIQCRCVQMLLRRRFAAPEEYKSMTQIEEFPVEPPSVEVKNVKTQRPLNNN